MEEDIYLAGSRNVHFIYKINRELTEKALHMRCQSYLAKVKESLLIETIYEIDTSKKNLKQMNDQIMKQKKKLDSKQEELEERNELLMALQNELEMKIRERTAKLEEANEKLRMEIREREAAEKKKEFYWKQLVQSQKLETIGSLTDGIVHDFKNLLTSIMGNSQYMLLKLPPNDPNAENITAILAAGDKCASLINHLLAFSRKGRVETTSVNLNSVAADLVMILKRLLGVQIKIECHFEEDLRLIKADICQVEQIFLNLAINARDAMPGGGRLIIETANIALDKSYSRFHRKVTPGQYVLLSVTDTGEGMSREIQEKAFEPFFTTKKVGRGTGLGLSTIQGIMKQYGAFVSVYSEKGNGTTFKLYFKAIPGRTEVPGQIKMPRGEETILVVENDDSVRALVVETLFSLGYTIFEASNGMDGWKIYKNKKIDIVLSDIIMPEVNGLRLREMIRNDNPLAKVILMSSYTEKVYSDKNRIPGQLPFLQKPFTPSRLANVLRSCLDNKLEVG